MADIFVIIFGLIVGSFLTVCIYRIPYGREKGPGEFDPDYEEISEDDVVEDIAAGEEGEVLNIYTPRRSICPNCKNQLKWYHNIPVFSWIFLRGKCAFCHEHISIRYPLVEILTAVLAWLSFTSIADIPTAALVFVFCCALLVISFIDIEYYIVPNVISIPFIYLGIILVAINHLMTYLSGQPIFTFPVMQSLMGSLFGLIFGAGILFAVAKLFLLIAKKDGLGFGDVKLLAMVGVLFGAQASIYTIMVGSCIACVFGVVQLFFQGKRLGYPLPFAPYLVIGTYLYLFLDPAIDPFRKFFLFL